MSSRERQTPQLITEYQERLARVEKYEQLTNEAKEILKQKGTTCRVEYRVGRVFLGRVIKQNLLLATLTLPDSNASINIYGFSKTKGGNEVDDPILVYPVDDRVSRHVVLGRGRVPCGPRSDWLHGFVYPEPRQTVFDLPYTDLLPSKDFAEGPIKSILYPYESVYYNPRALEIGKLPPKYLDHLLELLHSVH